MAKSTSSLASSTYSTSSSSSSSISSTSSSSSTRSTRQLSSRDKSLGLNKTSTIDKRKREAANARERKRMHLLNEAYDRLRLKLVDSENKSKYDVLIQAKEYIQALASICETFDKSQQQQQQQQQYLNQISSPIKIETAPLDMSMYTSTTTLSPPYSQIFTPPTIDSQQTMTNLTPPNKIKLQTKID